MECLRDSFDSGVVLDGRYQTVSPLNHGSFGMVFMAKDLQSGETVAIKCLTKKAAADEFGFELAIDDKSEELALHRRLGLHPNIVSLIDSFETDAHVYLVLEFCSRGDLYEAIRHGFGPLETEHVREFMLQMVDAVAYMHSKGVYHRDIKPENIFLTNSGSLKLGDFGLATTDKWSFEATVGSDRYMSPEQYDSAGAGYSPAQADVWAIGICLLNILFSRNPFTTPTEADPLFLDFSRDRQSLFDVFPSMSQDTFEVIVQCMNLDPTRRSLDGARQALRRVVSFTTDDEVLDDFYSSERRTLATANREPLRTPSIQSPQVDGGAFPWAKALHSTPPMAIRQLSMIPDEDAESSYTEDLFSQSAATTTDWCSAAGQTPSLDSVLNSSLGASLSSLTINRAQQLKTSAKVSPMAGSLPITMSRPRQQSAMSMVFGRKDGVSKSWSDMWEEEEEEAEENERSRQLQTLKELNSRTWSHESRSVADEHKAAIVDDDDTPRQGLSPATKASSLDIAGHVPSIEHKIMNNVDDDLPADGFFFHEDAFEEDQVTLVPTHGHQQPLAHSPSRYSPPPKRSPLDKWVALGERRRAYAGADASARTAKPSSAKSAADVILRTGRDHTGIGFSSLGPGVWDHYNIGHHQSNNISTTSPSHNFFYNTAFHHANSNNNTSSHHHPQGKWSAPKDRAKDCPWNKGRDSNWRRERRPELGVEWVGGW